MLPYLRRCVASVKDQQVNHEHVVMDGGSNDGTVEWLKENSSIKSVSEKDSGMYNALNKAIDNSQAEIIGHLNCDEQYLPGVLKFVEEYFIEHPEVDFLAADFIVTDSEGEFVAYRKAFQPRWQYFFSNYLYTTTCTLFYRRKIFSVCRFDESYRSIADVIFLYDVMRKGFKGAHVKKFFATFTYSGENLSLQPISAIEKAKFSKTLPLWFRTARIFFIPFFYCERIINRTFSENSPLSYSIFTNDNLSKRKVFVTENPDYRLKFVPKKP